MKQTKIINADNETVEVNITKCKRYVRYGGQYSMFFDCTKCKNASWYDDNYCNNQVIDFVDKDGVKTTKVYCERFEVE